MAVTSTNNLRQGSSGSDVLELQKLLNSAGNYNLAEDGIFGSKTLAAVKDYQQNNSLTVDGIVGTQTWGALTNASNTSAQTPAQEEVKAPTFEYKPSDTVTQAEALLQQQLAQKPGAYQSTWQDQLNDTLQQILNRDKFTYDLNGDMLYQQYADQFKTQGKLASMDVMGQAAAMTGGYGNSYAQTAGQQAYQAYLQQLNDVVPELYGMARDQHNQETQALYDQAALMAQMEDQDYGRYRDQMSDYYTELNRLTEDARYMSETEYQKAMDDFNIKYGSYRDSVSDQQWQAQFDEAKRQYDEQMALSKSKSYSSGGSGGSNNSSAGKISAGQLGGVIGSVIGSVTGVSDIPQSVITKVEGITDDAQLANYLDGITGTQITQDQADALYAQYKQPDIASLSKRTWTVEDDGGWNWFGGVDNNAVVKDQYGNTYSLDKLVDALVAEGMSKSEAKTYVKNLQARLGV